MTGRSLSRLVRFLAVNYSVVVDVTLRDGIADPEGATIERALPALGFSGVHEVKAGKSFRMTIDADARRRGPREGRRPWPSACSPIP